MASVTTGKDDKTSESAIRNNGIEEVVGSIPSGSTTLTYCFCYVLSLTDSPRHVRDLAGRCDKERVSETPKSETSRANPAGVSERKISFSVESVEAT
jgi:hypothetical protein